ncbi:MAG: hypothetical protein ABR536_04310 [Solirubrobacterales bacterium]
MDLATIPLAAGAAASSSPPAGGAEIGQVIIATVAGALVTGLLLFLGAGHRSGRVAVLGRLAAGAERRLGMPGWAALPLILVTPSLIIALFGMMWDISIHIDQGRDPGPLANPAHYFILFGLFGIFSAGLLAIVLPTERPSPAALRISGDWYAPLGGVLILAAGSFSLLGFPLDDIWHRLFGQDVTLWGPTHLMLIGGAVLAVLSTGVLLAEGERLGRRKEGEPPLSYFGRRIALPGAFLIALSTFQAEFDFGVPQFRFVFAPMLVMLAAAAALVAVRLAAGRGAAILAVLFFATIRGAYSLIVGPGLGEALAHFPVYLPEAFLVELAAFAIKPARRPLAFGAGAGALIGTVGLAAEWGWSHVWATTPWPSSLFPEGAVLGFGMALAGGILGAWMGARLRADKVARRPDLRWAAVASAVAVAVMVVYALPKPAESGVRADVTLTDARPAPQREVDATVRLDPPTAADNARWLNVTAWQGGGLVVDSLQRVSEGVYRTTEPIPVYGDWKALLRLHDGRSLAAVPVFLPEDPAIPAEGVPAATHFNREFTSDHQILQREQASAAGWLPPLAYAVVLALALMFTALVAWGIHRVAVTIGEGGTPAPSASRRRSGDDRKTGSGARAGGALPQSG